MNKGQQKFIRNVQKSVVKTTHAVSHNLGIAAKPLKETTTKEIMDLISTIYYTPGAIEQIENTLCGREDSRGPLSKVERQMISQNPVLSH